MTIATVPNATVPKGGSSHFTQPKFSTIRNTLEEYLRKKWIRSSRSAHAAPVMQVPEKGDPPGSPGSRLAVNYRPLSAVTTAPEFDWAVMPFGLKGAPSTFQATMDFIFFDTLGQGVLIYMDHVLVYTTTFDTVLTRLLQHKMYPNLAKCKFAAQSIEYLGYRVRADGIHPSTEKVSAIVLWPTEVPNETQVRQFLGTAN
ncbi:hypothetical protein Esti_002197 [Eimeria stiedai]